MHYKTGNCLLTAHFSLDDIAKILQNLDPNKAHNHDNISILQLCGNLICKPSELILNSLWKVVLFRLNGKKVTFQSIKKMTMFKILPLCISATNLWKNVLAITHEKYKSFGEGFAVAGVFLEISKAFGKVLIFKLKKWHIW